MGGVLVPVAGAHGFSPQVVVLGAPFPPGANDLQASWAA